MRENMTDANKSETESGGTTNLEHRSRQVSPVKEGNHFLSNIADWLDRIVTPLCKAGIVISGIMGALMMVLTFVDVFGRYALNKPILGSFEITQMFMAILVIFGLGYCALHKGHIRVDLILMYVSKKTNRIIDVFTYGIAGIFYALITWQSWESAWSNYHDHVTTSVLYIPIFPFVFLLVIGAGVITLVFIKDTVAGINEVVKQWNQ
jgi:TRAP-type C4-dicarboxylate transport system permease small subunit